MPPTRQPMPRVRRRGAVALLFVALAVLAGCGDSEARYDGPASGSICRGDGACPGSQICRAGFCTVDERGAIDVDARFFPPNSSPFLAQSVESLTVGPEDPSLDVALEPSIVLSGEIGVDSGPRCVPGGELIFERKTGSGAPPDVSRSTRTALEPEPRTFEVTLLEGLYDIRFNPANDQCEDENPYPPFVWRNKRLAGAGIDLENLPNRDAVVRIQGQLEFSQIGGEQLSTAKPAKVFAVGSETSTFRTTIDVTDTSDRTAQFELFAPPSDRPVRYDLVVGPSPRVSADRAIATTRIRSEEIDTAGESEGLVVQGSATSVKLNPVEVGPYPSVDAGGVELAFELPEGIDPNGVDWTEFRAVVEAKNFEAGTFVRSGYLDEDGIFEPTIWRVGTYEGWVLPPPNSQLGPRHFEFEAMQPGTVVLETKNRFNGRVVDSQGNPLAGASIEATILADGAAPPGVDRRLRSRRTATARTDDEGTFEIWLEEANYRIVVQPPVDEGLPRHVTRLTTGEISEGEQLQFRVPEPRLLRGHVYGELFTSEGTRSQPLPKTQIEIHGDRFGLDTTLARARSRAEGAFSLLLPASND